MNIVSGPLLAEALAVLRALPRQRQETRDARARFERFKASHPDLPCRLLVASKPGSDEVDYDILLTIAEAGTVSLSWRPDLGVPWIAQYADHWAANFVLSVNDRSTTIQSALLYLSGRLRRRPDLMRDLVDRTLAYAAIEESPPKITEAELEAGVDAFRSGLGLFSGAATQQWLDDMQLTMEALEELVAQTLQLEAFKQAVVAARVRPHFEKHRRDFDRLTVMRLEGLTRLAARDVAEAWRRDGVCPVFNGAVASLRAPRGRLETLFAGDLPAALAGAPDGAVIGPEAEGGAFWVGQVLGRSRARFDQATRDLIGTRLFEAWLAEQRAKASIQWHWV